MEGKQLNFDDLLSSPSPAPLNKQSKAQPTADPFLIGAAILLNQWEVEKKTQNLALRILGNGYNEYQVSNRNVQSFNSRH